MLVLVPDCAPATLQTSTLGCPFQTVMTRLGCCYPLCAACRRMCRSTPTPKRLQQSSMWTCRCVCAGPCCGAVLSQQVQEALDTRVPEGQQQQACTPCLVVAGRGLAGQRASRHGAFCQAVSPVVLLTPLAPVLALPCVRACTFHLCAGATSHDGPGQQAGLVPLVPHHRQALPAHLVGGPADNADHRHARGHGHDTPAGLLMLLGECQVLSLGGLVVIWLMFGLYRQG